MPFVSVPEAIEEIRAGRMLVIVDDEDRENEGDLAVAAEKITPFHSTAQGFSLPDGQALPTLNLSRVYVLVGSGTCSASEAIVNGLRGVGVTVNLIGATTCGKPYGFYPTDNCDTTYFAIQFQGVNQLGQGDYADGFAPTCAARPARSSSVRFLATGPPSSPSSPTST